MLAIFGTPHKSNVLLANFLVYVSAPTVLIMDFTILGQIVACAMRLTSACFPTIESLNGKLVARNNWTMVMGQGYTYQSYS